MGLARHRRASYKRTTRLKPGPYHVPISSPPERNNSETPDAMFSYIYIAYFVQEVLASCASDLQKRAVRTDDAAPLVFDYV